MLCSDKSSFLPLLLASLDFFGSFRSLKSLSSGLGSGWSKNKNKNSVLWTKDMIFKAQKIFLTFK